MENWLDNYENKDFLSQSFIKIPSAQNGTGIPTSVKIKNKNGKEIVLQTDSPEYDSLYENNYIEGFYDDNGTYNVSKLEAQKNIPEVSLKAKKADWLKYKQEFLKNHPKEKFIQDYLDAFPWAGQSLNNYPKRLDEDYETQLNDYIGEQIVKNKPQGNKSREDWLNSMTEQEQRFVQRNPKYGTTLWQDTVEGGKALFNLGNDLQISRIKNSDNYTNLEKKDLIQQHEENPILSNIGDVAQSLSFLTVPSKMVQSTLRPEYSFSDAVQGTKNKAGAAEDILTDPLNLVGVGIAKNLGRFSKSAEMLQDLNQTNNEFRYANEAWSASRLRNEIDVAKKQVQIYTGFENAATGRNKYISDNIKKYLQDYKDGIISLDEYKVLTTPKNITDVNRLRRTAEGKLNALRTNQENIVQNFDNFTPSYTGGSNNLGITVLDDNHIVRHSMYSYNDTANDMLGASINIDNPRVMRTLQVGEDSMGRTHQVQQRAKGKTLDKLTQEEISSIPNEHYAQMQKDLDYLASKNISVDVSKPDNFFYDPNVGFQFIDLQRKTGTVNPNKMDDIFSVVKSDSGIEYNSYNNWKNLVKKEEVENINPSLVDDFSESFGLLGRSAKRFAKTLPIKLLPGHSNRAERALELGNNWNRDWYNNPITQDRLNNLINNSNFLERIVWKNMQEAIKDEAYTSHFQSNLGKIVRFLNHKPHFHDDNMGFSITGLKESLDPIAPLNKNYTQSFVDKYLPPPRIKSTAIHEGNHNVYNSDSFSGTIFSSMLNKNPQKPLRDIPADKLAKYDEYLSIPEEIYARIQEIRAENKLVPGELLTDKMVDEIFNKGLSGKSNVDSRFYQLVDKDKFKKVVNVVPAVGAVGMGAAAVSEKKLGGNVRNSLNELLTKFQKGGVTESKWEYSDTNGVLKPQTMLKTDEIGYLKDWLSSPMAKKIALKREGGVIKDNNGYWNPDNWGKVVEIDSNDITMKGVNQPLLGISDEGDVQYMEPNKDYKFKGKKVRKFPIARNGINNLDENSLQQLDQLTNFTNYNKLSNGGWLDKF